MDTPAAKTSAIPPINAETLEEARAQFAADRFATQQCGAVIEEARAGYAVCSMQVKDAHRNAMGNVMGGAIYTLADFAGAVASNINQVPCVSVSNEIQYLAAAKGDRLVATCTEEKSGRRMCFYTVRVTDGEGRLIALMHATSARIG